MKTQTERVLDGGPTITRLAARIQDAEDRGYVFEHLGTRHDCRVYRLVSRPESVELAQKKPNTTNPEPASLFKTPVGKAQFGYADQGELDAA